ncbi:hypothetical protein DFJ74DRAFT_690902 [Hyaloraphidium curvatum]|nr:hypothetical protein DFJ74DRAFT_690902 [Hyaloraphidium curvatum]
MPGYAPAGRAATRLLRRPLRCGPPPAVAAPRSFASAASPAWSRLIRFVPAGAPADQWAYGEPLTLEADGSLPRNAAGIRARRVEPGPGGDVFGRECRVTSEELSVGKLLPPLARVPIFLCIGLNYHLHAQETGQPVPRTPILFTKPPNALNGPGAPIVVPKCATNNQADYEVELAVVIGKRGKDIPESEARAHIAAFTAANDISARKWQGNLQSNQWTFAKSFDGWAPLGPQLVSSRAFDPSDAPLRGRVNGATLQDARTGDMIFNVDRIVSFLSQGTTLEPGTVILTGTPSGVGFKRTPPVFLQDGDTVEVEIEGIGTVENTVVYEK